MELSVLNTQGQETGNTVNLSDGVFAIEPNDHAIYLAVKQYNANQRQGTHKSKERAEITGSTRKIKRQKGSGTARAGSIKSPVFRGGGRVFGPRPRDYSFKLNKKVKTLAKNSLLTYKAKENAIKVLENVSFETPQTKAYQNILNGLSLEGKKTVLVLAEKNENIYLSSRNLKRTKVVTAETLNVYDIINADTLIVCEGAVEKFNA
jgi:large subunit ribosomal protein L4